MKEGKNHESTGGKSILSKKTANANALHGKWMVYFTGVIDNGRGSGRDSQRWEELDVKGCCQDIGLHSKNNMKLLKSFIFLD